MEGMTAVVDEVTVSEEQGTVAHGTSLPGAVEAALGCCKRAPGGLRKETTAPRPRGGRLEPANLCLCRATLQHFVGLAAAISERASTTLAPFLGLQLGPYDLVAC